MVNPSVALAWDEHKVLSYILEHHPVLQSQIEAHATQKMLDRLPVIEAMIGERYQSSATLEAAESAAERVQAVAADRTDAAKTALENATEKDKKNAERELRSAQRLQAQETANANTMVERARIAANYDDYSNRRRYALAELGQLRRRLAEKAARRADEETKAGEIRQTALGGMAKLRELEAERAALQERLAFHRRRPIGCKNASRRATRATSKSSGKPPRSKTRKPPPSNASTC
ncbi:MAG: hypothetical protein U1F59_00900 [Candidatus Competibacteraceae bacterium]